MLAEGSRWSGAARLGVGWRTAVSMPGSHAPPVAPITILGTYLASRGSLLVTILAVGRYHNKKPCQSKNIIHLRTNRH